jgi:hypothetical protein
MNIVINEKTLSKTFLSDRQSCKIGVAREKSEGKAEMFG